MAMRRGGGIAPYVFTRVPPAVKVIINTTL